MTGHFTHLREPPHNRKEKDGKCDLVHETPGRLLDWVWVVVEHSLEVGSNSFQHQNVMFSIYPLHLEMIQEGEDAIGPRMSPRSSLKATMGRDFAILAGKLGNGELEGDVLAIRDKYFQ